MGLLSRSLSGSNWFLQFSALIFNQSSTVRRGRPQADMSLHVISLGEDWSCSTDSHIQGHHTVTQVRETLTGLDYSDSA